MRCKSLSWNVLALLPQSLHTLWCLYRAAPVLLQKTHWMCTPHPASKMTVLTKSCSTCAACEIQVTTLSSLPDTYFEVCMACIYTCIYRICTYLSAATKERKRESWAMHALHPVLTTLMMFRTAEDDVWFSAGLSVCVGGNCATRFLRMHTGSDYGNSLQFKAEPGDSMNQSASSMHTVSGERNTKEEEKWKRKERGNEVGVPRNNVHRKNLASGMARSARVGIISVFIIQMYAFNNSRALLFKEGRARLCTDWWKEGTFPSLLKSK